MKNTVACTFALGLVFSVLNPTAVAHPLNATENTVQENTSKYSSGLNQEELDEMFSNHISPRVNEQAFTEGSATMQTRSQKHFSTIRKGKLIHLWAGINPTTHTHERTNREEIPGDDYVGTPVTLHEASQQHFVGRTRTGQIRHHMWSPSTGRVTSSFHLIQNAPAAAHDPALAWMSQQLHLFYVDSNGRLQHRWTGNPTNKWSHADSWSQAIQSKLGATKFMGKPSLFQWHNQQHVFVRTTDNRLAHFFWFPGASGIQFHFWTATPVASDPVTLATKEKQSIFYNDTNGHLQRLRWLARENASETYNWSKAHTSKPYMAVGRPQVFEVYGQDHVVLRHIDGSVSHAFKNDSDSRPIHHQIHEPGTTNADISAARLFQSQDTFVINRSGTVQHRLWRPHAPSGQPHILHYRWSRIPQAKSVTLPANSHTQLQAVRGPGRALYLSMVSASKHGTARYAARVSKDEWNGRPQKGPELDSQPLPPFDGSFTGAVPIWQPNGTDQMHLTALSDQGTVFSLHEPRHFGGRGVFAKKPLVSAYGANGSVDSATTRSSGRLITGHVVHTERGILFARVLQKTNTANKPQRIRWTPIRLGQLNNKSVSVSGSKDRFWVHFVDNDGRVVSGQANDEARPVAWTKLPELPDGKKVLGKVAVSSYANGIQRIVAKSASGHIFTISQVKSEGPRSSPSWNRKWQQISTEPTLGNPDLITLTDGSMRAVTRTKSKRLLISHGGPNAKDALSTLKNPNSPAGKHELATDLQLVTFTKSQQFKFLVLGLKPDKSVFAVGAGQSGVRSAQSHAEETLHPAKLEPKK